MGLHAYGIDLYQHGTRQSLFKNHIWMGGCFFNALAKFSAQKYHPLPLSMGPEKTSPIRTVESHGSWQVSYETNSKTVQPQFWKLVGRKAHFNIPRLWDYMLMG